MAQKIKKEPGVRNIKAGRDRQPAMGLKPSVEPPRRSTLILPPSPNDDDWLPDLDIEVKEESFPMSSADSIPNNTRLEKLVGMHRRSDSPILHLPCALSPPTSHNSDSSVDLSKPESPPHSNCFDSDSDIEILAVIDPPTQARKEKEKCASVKNSRPQFEQGLSAKPGEGLRHAVSQPASQSTPGRSIGQLTKTELRAKIDKFRKTLTPPKRASDHHDKEKTKRNDTFFTPCPIATQIRANSTTPSTTSQPRPNSDSDCEIVDYIPVRKPDVKPPSTPVKSQPVSQNADNEGELPVLQSPRDRPSTSKHRLPASPRKPGQRGTPVKKSRKGSSVALPSAGGPSLSQRTLLASPEKLLQLSPKVKCSLPQKHALKRKMSNRGLLSPDKHLRQLNLDNFRVKKECISVIPEDEMKLSGVSSSFIPGTSSQSSSINSEGSASLNTLDPSTSQASQHTSYEDPNAGVTMPKVPRMDAQLVTSSGSALGRGKAPTQSARRDVEMESEPALHRSQARTMHQLTMDAFRVQTLEPDNEASSGEDETELPVMSEVDLHYIRMEVNHKLAFLNISKEVVPHVELMQRALKALFLGEAGRTMQPVHRLLQQVRKLHPPSSEGAVAMYHQAFLMQLEGGEATRGEEIARDSVLAWKLSWSFLCSIIRGAVEADQESWERRQLLLEYVVSVLQDNLRAASPRVLCKPALRARRLREVLVVGMLWKKGHTLGMGDHVLDLLQLLSNALPVQGCSLHRKSRLLRSLFCLASMVVESLTLAAGGSLSALMSSTTCHIAVASDFVRDLAKATEAMVKGMEVELLRSLLSSVEPPWLGLMLAQHWLCSLDALSLAQPLTLPDLSLHALMEQFFSLLLNLSERQPSEDGETRNPTDNFTGNSTQVARKKGAKKNQHGEIPLHIACKKGKIDKVKELLEEPDVDVNARDNFDWTPLHEACQLNHEECALALLDHRPPQGSTECSVVDPALQSKNGTSALHYAVKAGNLTLCKRLLARGGARLLGLKDDSGHTPLMQAPREFREQLLEEVRKQQVDGTAVSVDNITRYIILITHLIICYLKTFVWQNSHPGTGRITPGTGVNTSREIHGPSSSSQNPTSLGRVLCHSLQANSCREGSQSIQTSSGLPCNQVQTKTDRIEENRLNQSDKSDTAILANLLLHLQQFRQHVHSLCSGLSGERKVALDAYLDPLMLLGHQVQLTFSGRPPSSPVLR